MWSEEHDSIAEANIKATEMVLTDDQLSLRQRLDNFDLDDPDSRLKFSERLARENNWTMRYARRVVAEYKRFLELAVTAGHMVTPSDDVDQAWHLHMVYTHSYWDELCQKVLRQPLHHGPTKGGKRERERYEDLYAKTLSTYYQTFGENPPPDIWPDGEERFRQSIQSVRVDRGRHWVIAKPSWAQVARVGAFASAPIIFGTSDHLLGTGLLEVNGQTFLAIYVLAFVIAAACSFFLKARLRPDTDLGKAPAEAEKVGWAATAVLAGGYNRAVMAVIARLRTEGKVNLVRNRLVADTKGSQALSTTIDDKGWNPQSATPSTSEKKPLTDTKEDIALLEAAEKMILSESKGIKVDKFTSALYSELNHISIQLEQRELWLSSGERVTLGMTTAGPLVFLFLVGVARCVLGVMRDRPIGILMLLIFITAAACLMFMFSFPRRTRLGDRYLERLKIQYPRAYNRAELTEVASAHSKVYDPASASPFFMALYGTAFMSQFTLGDDAAFYNTLHSQARSISGGDGGGFSGGGCGGDGGGCGGCGGCGG